MANNEKTNLEDYLIWRGDLPFERDPVNAADALLFACISYVDFEGVIPVKGAISLRDAASRFYEIHTEEQLESDRSFIRFAPGLLKKAAETVRFGNLQLSSYVNKINQIDMIQFSAITIRISPSEVFIAYRGTDDTIVGWKEDFYMSYATVISEDLAVEYLKEVQGGRSDRIYMGGHSKGGHMAIFSAYCTTPDIQDRIGAIYDFDGPGFNDAIMRTDRFRKIGPKILRYIPENSIIGRLLSDTARPVVVSSSERGIMQHDPMSWGISSKEFITVPKNSVASDVFDETLTKWIDEMDQEERKKFIDELFAVLEASGVTNISMLSQCGLSGVKAMLRQMHTLRKSSQSKIRILLRLFIDNWGDVIADIARSTKEEAESKLLLHRVIEEARRKKLEGGGA
ncbi:Protein of unknown function [Ruminococcaceae bacterium YRB3002]|nr:Protein of unknown function [Ruminococcaceae bacterium YRB3002]